MGIESYLFRHLICPSSVPFPYATSSKGGVVDFLGAWQHLRLSGSPIRVLLNLTQSDLTIMMTIPRHNETGRLPNKLTIYRHG
jgi:hypothetical protein